ENLVGLEGNQADLRMPDRCPTRVGKQRSPLRFLDGRRENGIGGDEQRVANDSVTRSWDRARDRFGFPISNDHSADTKIVSRDRKGKQLDGGLEVLPSENLQPPARIVPFQKHGAGGPVFPVGVL